MTAESNSENSIPTPSTKPYLIRALYDWCVDHNFTPYIVVFVDAQVTVPMEFVKNGEIVLNISPEACQKMQLDNDWISFEARFGGVPKSIYVPVSHVMAIYARENGQGMSFPVNIPLESTKETQTDTSENPPGITSGPKGRPHLKLVK